MYYTWAIKISSRRQGGVVEQIIAARRVRPDALGAARRRFSFGAEIEIVGVKIILLEFAFTLQILIYSGHGCVRLLSLKLNCHLKTRFVLSYLVGISRVGNWKRFFVLSLCVCVCECVCIILCLFGPKTFFCVRNFGKKNNK